ncbi:MAG TPA: XdhC family protein [Thermoanaerobaculia bacterium]|nr:XdhC family protein [Thermoanaerobaculia bacterium]
MRPDLLTLCGDLVRREEPFVLATVVRRLAASSAQQGDGAIVTTAGEFHGWLGGSCTQPTVVAEALKALADGRPRLIALSPNPGAEGRPGVLVFPMTCHSGGTVEIYLEPVLPRARVLVFGVSPVARALARQARAMDFAVDAADPEADRAAFPEAERLFPGAIAADAGSATRTFAVVATMGERDEEALAAALALDPAYLGVVASGKRFARVRDALLARGAAADRLARVKNPAGLDIGARTPEEIAVSILAEIVQWRRAAEAASPGAGARGPVALPVAAAAEHVDPVCGMKVAEAGARHTAEAAGRTWYFCCGGCRERFLAAPERYAVQAGIGGMA